MGEMVVHLIFGNLDRLSLVANRRLLRFVVVMVAVFRL
jgi:hypothetical protein